MRSLLECWVEPGFSGPDLIALQLESYDLGLPKPQNGALSVWEAFPPMDAAEALSFRTATSVSSN